MPTDTLVKPAFAAISRNSSILEAAEKPLLFYELKQEGGDLLALLESELVYDYAAEDEFDDDDFFNS